MTFRQLLTRNLTLSFTVVLLLGLFYGMARLVAPAHFDGVVNFSEPPRSTHVVPDAAAALLAQHDCWTGYAPTGVTVPGHVVVTLPDGTVRYGGARLVHAALEQAFNGVDAGLAVHGFCR